MPYILGFCNLGRGKGYFFREKNKVFHYYVYAYNMQLCDCPLFSFLKY